MTFAEGVMRLVRIGARVDVRDVPATAAPERRLEAARFAEAVVPEFDDAAAWDAAEEDEPQPGLADLEASVALVSSGLASRVVLTGFPAWPGLLWHAYQLAEVSDVLIIPTVVRPGGKVDIEITRSDTAVV
jgi:hypothetical protein